MKSILPILLACVLCGCEAQSTVTPRVDQPSPRKPATLQVLVFTATWCGPCQRDKPAVARLNNRGVSVTSVDVDQRSDLVRKYRIQSIPTYVILENGRETYRTQDVRQLQNTLKRSLHAPKKHPPKYPRL